MNTTMSRGKEENAGAPIHIHIKRLAAFRGDLPNACAQRKDECERLITLTVFPFCGAEPMPLSSDTPASSISRIALEIRTSVAAEPDLWKVPLGRSLTTTKGADVA